MSKVRQWWYLIAGAIAAIIPILVQLGVIGSDQARSGSVLIETLSSLIGGAGALTAGTILSKQRKQGNVDLSPIDLVVNNIPVVYEQAVRAEANVRKMQNVANDVLNGIGLSLPNLPNLPGLPNLNQSSDEQSLADAVLREIKS